MKGIYTYNQTHTHVLQDNSNNLGHALNKDMRLATHFNVHIYEGYIKAEVMLQLNGKQMGKCPGRIDRQLTRKIMGLH